MISNFPSGFSSGLLVRGMPLVQMQPGNVFWVNSSSVLNAQANAGSDGNRGTYLSPFATLQYALDRCTAGRGDVVFVGAGHTETINTATALAFNKAGVAIIGLGTGNHRPTFTLAGANTATIAVSAAGISVQNCVFIGNFLSIASCFTVGAAPDFSIDSCAFRDTSAILGFLSIVTTTVTVNADRLAYTNNSRISIATTSPGPDMVVAGTMAGLRLTDNRSTHLVASNNVAALLNHGALVMTDLQVYRNMVFSVNTDTATGALLVVTSAITGSGMIAHNRMRALDIAAAIVVTATAVQYGLFDNLYIGDGTYNSGFVLPAIGSDA